MTGRKVHAEKTSIGTAFELGPAGTAQRVSATVRPYQEVYEIIKVYNSK